MIKFKLKRTALLGAVCIPASIAVPVFAQDEGGLTITLGVEQRFEAGENITLATPEQGSGAAATTTLAFGLRSETRTQSIYVDFDNVLRITDLPGEGTETDIDETTLDFGYARESANALLTFDGSHSKTDIEFPAPLTEFFTDDGEIELPADFEDLTGGGDREAYSYTAGLEIGREELIGFRFGLSTEEIDYSGTTDPGLNKSNTDTVEVGTILRFSPRTTGRIDLSAEYYEADDAEQTERDTGTVVFGLLHELTPRLTVDTEIGYVDIDEDEIDPIAGPVNTKITGVTGGVALAYAMPNGTLTGEIATTRDIAARVNTILVGRSLDLPNGSFAGTIGVGHVAGDDTDIIGSLTLRQEVGSGDIIADISREIVASRDDESRTETVLRLGYLHYLDPVSTFGVSLASVMTESTPSDPRLHRTEINAVYSRDLTEDWELNTGITYRVRDEDTVSRDDSTLLFVSIGREFSIRP